jgi:hypothetical protein
MEPLLAAPPGASTNRIGICEKRMPLSPRRVGEATDAGGIVTDPIDEGMRRLRSCLAG